MALTFPDYFLARESLRNVFYGNVVAGEQRKRADLRDRIHVRGDRELLATLDAA
ncbi:hypothetical protein [Arthrobacter sp. I3]|uniref:hypothetical protein n=1 Tax=Arthrobacter sp. I3 TaxID=218158 RepID=UPI0004B75CCB|nr:hypothetical protein [Arthrobacter sp. I3]